MTGSVLDAVATAAATVSKATLGSTFAVTDAAEVVVWLAEPNTPAVATTDTVDMWDTAPGAATNAVPVADAVVDADTAAETAPEVRTRSRKPMPVSEASAVPTTTGADDDEPAVTVAVAHTIAKSLPVAVPNVPAGDSEIVPNVAPDAAIEVTS